MSLAGKTAKRETERHVLALLDELAASQQEVARLWKAREADIERFRLDLLARDKQQDGLRRLCSTVLVEPEYRALLKWREHFLNRDDEEAPLLPPDPQLICYAIVDAMTLRQMHDVLHYQQACGEAQSGDARSAVGKTEPGNS